MGLWRPASVLSPWRSPGPLAPVRNSRPATLHSPRWRVADEQGLNKRLRRASPSEGRRMSSKSQAELLSGSPPEWRQVSGGFETCRHLAGAARAGNVRPPTGRKSAHRAGPGTSQNPSAHFRELIRQIRHLRGRDLSAERGLGGLGFVRLSGGFEQGEHILGMALC